GHEVTVLTAQPCYNDIRGPRQPWRDTQRGVEIRRLRLLPERKRWRVLWLANCCYFLLRCLLHALTPWRRYDLILGAPTHPILSAWALSWMGYLTGTPYVIHSQDIHPEAAACAGLIAKGWFYRFLMAIDTASYSGAAYVVAISEDQRAYLARRHPELGWRLVSIPNPPLDTAASFRTDIPDGFIPLRADGSVPYRVIFAGNIGNFQALDAVAEAILQLGQPERIHFHFVGEGLAKSRLQTRLQTEVGRSVFFWPHQSVETAFAMMRTSDLGIVSLHPGMYEFAFPSKMAMYLAAGCPVLAIIEPQSELAELVRSKRLGFVAASHEPEAIVAAIEDANRSSLTEGAAHRERIRRFAEQAYGREGFLDAWRKLLPGSRDEPVRRAA
ncbi:MAG TPA: glycosyltransferase family 4 protein, partial [Pirellulaceae bacterium]